ncbi:hypothetical protein CR513_01671, partial [Mucuna pruriens]
MTNPSRKDWSRLLEDALWEHRTAYRTPLGMSPYRIVFGKTRHLLKVKKFHDQQILRKDLQVGQKVLLFNSRLKLIAGKLHSRWDRPFIITSIFPYGVVQLKDEQSNNTFQVNGHQIKPFYEGLAPIVEIELTLRRIRKNKKAKINSGSAGSVLDSNLLHTDILVSSSNTFTELGQMVNHDRTLKELATPDVVYQPWCIQYPQLEPAQTYELKSGLIHLLPKFHGLAGEDPHKHLKEFHVVCSTMRPQGIPEDYIKMKAFPFSLDGAAKDWLYLQPALFNTWGDMKQTFLEKFFPASKIATIRKEIYGIRKHTGETLHEYWERFNKLCATCPHHQISEQLLIQYFYEGLSMMDRSMIDAASGGALMDKTPAAARHLISNMASNTQQFGIRGPNPSRPVNEIGAASNQRMENQLTELTSLVRQLAVSQHHPAMAAKVCGICTSMEHPTDLCPTLQETESGQTESVGVVGGFQYGKQPCQTRQFDNQPYGRQSFRPGPQQGPYAAQRARSVPNMPYGAGGYPQPTLTIPNPRGNASAVTLRSGKELTQPAQHRMPKLVEADSKVIADSQLHPETAVPLSFPSWINSARKPESDEELLKMFRKVEINIPLLNAIKQIPKYAKFLKELCVHKRRKMKGSKEFGGMVSALTKRNSQVLLKKYRDPGIFSVPCTIGECTFADAMLDLGASINVMPTSIYRSLNFGDLEPTGMTIQLANRSNLQPLGVLEDVLVQVNKLISPADFYVLDMEDETSGKESTLILGRPFLMTARTKIDVHARTLSMEFSDTLVQFNIFEAMKHPTEDHSLFGIYMIEELVEEYFQLDSCREEVEDFAGIAKSSNCSKADYDEVQEFLDYEGDYGDVADLAFETELTELLNQPNSKADTLTEIISASENQTQTEVKLDVPPGSDSKATQEANADSVPTRTEATKSSQLKQLKAEIMSAHLVPSQEQVGQMDPSLVTEKSPSLPPMELKPLPSHLKYAYLDSEQQLPEQEDKLLKVLRQHKKAIGLNPTTLDVVKKEVTKLLAVGIIYPISNSQWVSPIQVVPKKSGMTVMKNQQNELVPTRIQNSWRVCIDYRRLNQATRKDHFPLPFIDQVLEKLYGKSHYCFLDEFSRYMQIHIAPEDQHKTTFTCPFGTFAYTRMPFGLCNAPSTF